ncbi:MFS transporter [Paracoccus sediminicola]|uniref:MFS transporter n=1 Tax=Paracoccus sediminicola TaxID=3017783 RepID=UPI0022F08257|nr:MFS transporter [Paracoccus sediminicola]WBU55739.1 MFS transporter [Paracoccus sediminicola]
MKQILLGIMPLLIGIFFILLGNGMQFTLVGLRGDLEGFSAADLAVVTSAYFVGYLLGARSTPGFIRRVGHVRVFAAVGSFMSAALIALTLIAEPFAWTLLRVVIGFCMAGIYVTAESWLNAEATNENRGTVLSVYMIAQTLGTIAAQGLLALGDAATASLFIVASIMVSISFGPILLSVSPTPAAQLSRPMALSELFRGAPLGTFGIFCLGTIYATQAGMGPVFGVQVGMSAQQVSLFMAMLFTGPLLLQVPIGWISDRVDRRLVIFATSAFGAVFCLSGWLIGGGQAALLGTAFLVGGVTMPLYALLLAYVNDGLPTEDMPAASGGMALTFGLGAILGPLAAGFVMQIFGAYMFWVSLGATFLCVALFALYRMTQREVPTPPSETESYIGVLPSATQITVAAAGSWSASQSKEQGEGEDAGEKDGEDRHEMQR